MQNEKQKPPKEVLIKHKQHQSVTEFAELLETIAKKLKEKQEFVFNQGEKSTVVQVGEQLKIEYEYTTRGNKHSFEIEFDWYTDKEESKPMSIE